MFCKDLNKKLILKEDETKKIIIIINWTQGFL